MNADFSDQTVWLRREGLAEAELDGERVVWDPRTSQVVRLDRIGSLIWSTMGDGVSIGELLAVLADVFDAPIERVREDVAPFLERLAAAGLIYQRPARGHVP